MSPSAFYILLPAWSRRLRRFRLPPARRFVKLARTPQLRCDRGQA